MEEAVGSNPTRSTNPMGYQMNLLVTRSEYTTLIRESTRVQVVSAEFGAFGVRLISSPTNQWAIDRIAEIRAGRGTIDPTDIESEQ